ncbi:uncharacterized protein LOC105683103 isoform X2 [Athalia rosae]|uniref:uncharacterized protein LOC105683103 isoform X2 n=1 Tax=Athalia rosae TaxID=37344 RepID=UPI00203447C3|nr:uncharacterized protein LOC105683103 isoform X2 [Athalia rosae]
METPAGSDDNQPQVTRTTKLPSPSRDFKYRKASESPTEISLSEEAAFSFLVEYDLTKSQYQGLRSLSKDINSKLYPPYRKLLQAKNCCYPPHMAITVTESSVAVQLQALLDHTVERISLLQSSLIRSLPQENVSNMVLVCKWGCDQSSGEIVPL